MRSQSKRDSGKPQPEKQVPSVSIKKIKDTVAGRAHRDSAAPLHPNFAQARKATQFKLGQSGNPSGRPRKVGMIGDLINEIGNEPLQSFTEVRSRWEWLVTGLFHCGMQGNPSAARELFDRVEGKVRFGVRDDGNGKMDELIAVLKAGPKDYVPPEHQNAQDEAEPAELDTEQNDDK